MKTNIEKPDIEARIKKVSYFRVEGTTVTLCNIEMVNGFSVLGESAHVDTNKVDETIGRRFAYEKAFSKLWELEGYLLAERLFQGGER